MAKHMGSYGAGFASGLTGGVKLAKTFKDALARYRVDQIAAAKAAQLDESARDDLRAADANAGATDVPLGAVPAVGSESIVPAAPVAETAPVIDSPVESKPLEDATATYEQQWTSTETPVNVPLPVTAG
jgi:hypothetical protein